MTTSRPAKPTWSLAGLRLGAVLALPALPGMIAFGLAIGATEACKRLGVLDSALMNVLVYAGASQLVAMEAWPDRVTVASLAALALLAATVNARMLLIGASLQPWLRVLPAWQAYPLLHLITDPGWLIAMRYRAQGGSDVSVFLGGAVLICVAWLAATAVGYVLGGLVADPRAIGLDLVMPIFFSTMLVPLWRGGRRALGWGVAGAVALVTARLVPGWWFVVAGALAGSVVEGFAAEAPDA
jgi:predicted branched-subunit amino acid permease